MRVITTKLWLLPLKLWKEFIRHSGEASSFQPSLLLSLVERDINVFHVEKKVSPGLSRLLPVSPRISSSLPVSPGPSRFLLVSPELSSSFPVSPRFSWSLPVSPATTFDEFEDGSRQSISTRWIEWSKFKRRTLNIWEGLNYAISVKTMAIFIKYIKKPILRSSINLSRENFNSYVSISSWKR